MIRKISHIAIVLILLVSTTGLTINLHYCNNRIYDLSVYSEATSCCIEGSHEHNTKDELHHDCDSENHEKDCKDKTVSIAPLHDFEKTINTYNVNNIESPSDLFFVYILLIEEPKLSNLASQLIPNFNILPPNINVVLAMFQSYLL